MYKDFKTHFNTKNYLEINIPKFQRSILAQFRIGILPIKVETGRYNGESLEDRLCNFCSKDEVEDEYHFLLNCTEYSNFRSDLFTSIKFNPTFSMSDQESVNFPRQTLKYLYLSYMLRQSLLYKKTPW